MDLLDDTETRESPQSQNEEARRIDTVGESPYVAEEIPDTEGPALGGLFAESQAQGQPEQLPETPRANRWGLSRFIPSAHSVTRYMPFSSRRNPTTPQQQAPQPEQPAQPEQTTQTEARVTARTSQSPREPERADTVTGPVHRHHQLTSNQQRLLTKQQWEEEKRIKRLRLQLRREAEALEKQKRAFELAKKELAEKQKSADVTQTPGQKRKRIPSPDVIPLPAGGGYGMVDEYFIVDSSSDDEIVAQETPTKERPSKKARTSTPDDFTVGSPFRARPYTGTLFTHPEAQQSPEDNVFNEANKSDGHPALDSTPPPGPTLVFKVPSPGSSDSDDEDDEQDQMIARTQKAPSPSVLAPKSILRNSTTNLSQPRPAANSTSPSKSMVPPPRPVPGHATLPAATMTAPSDALEKAREKALKHQPKQPSTLRESSRLSSSTVNSDPGDEGNVEEYDPANPAIILSPSKAPALGQHAPPNAPDFIPPPVRRVSSVGLQQPVTQAVSEQPQQQVMLKPSGKQAEAIHDVSAQANDSSSSSAAAISAEERRLVLEDAEHITTSTSQKIKADLDRWWKQHGDDYVSSEGYKEFEDDMLAEEQELMDVPNGDPYIQPRNIISAALNDIGADGLTDRGIQLDIEENWRPGDLERTQSDPENGMKVFFNRLVKNGVVEKDLADRVVAIGVPPGITKYLAGQEVMGPTAA